MADTKISALPDASPIAAGDALPIVRAGVTYRVAPSTLGATLFNSASASDARTAIGTDAAGATRPPSAHNHVASEITDSTATGRSLLTAADAGAARSAIGTDASGAARPPTAHTHVSNDVTDASTIGKTILTAADAAAVRTAIGTDASGASRPPTAHTQTASTISDATATGQALMTAANAAAALATLGTDASGTARPPTAHTHPSTAISDSTSIGRTILTAADDAAVRTAIGTDAAGATRPPSAHTHPSTAISDSTTVGKAVLTAATQADARTAIGADSPTDTRTPAAHTQAASTISDATATGIALMTAANAAAALSTLGTDAIGTARPPTAHTHAASAISDSTTIGRTVLTAADAAAVRTAIGTDASGATRPPSAHTHPSTELSDSTSIGRTILTAADAAAVRTAIGVGTGTTVASTDITDSTVTGRAVLTAANAAAARTAIGTDAPTDTRTPSAHTQAASTISDSTSIGRTILTAADAAAVRTALSTDTTSDTRTPSAHTQAASTISDSSIIGRTILTAADAAAVRTALSTDTTSDPRTPSAHTHPATAISDSSSVGRSVLTAVDAAAARTALGISEGGGGAHAATHYAGGADALTGQSISGLRTTDTPTFAGATLGDGSQGVLNLLGTGGGAQVGEIDWKYGANVLGFARVVRYTGNTTSNMTLGVASAGTPVTNLTLREDGSTVLGTDPGGSDILRVGGSIKASGNVDANGYARFGATDGPRIEFAPASGLIEFYNRGTLAYSAGRYLASSHSFEQGPVVVGTDPGGSDLLRVGGAVRAGYLAVVGSSGAFNTANKFGVDHYNGTARLYSNGPDASTRGGYAISICKSDGSDQLDPILINSSGLVRFVYDTVIGVDPGGSELLRVGGGARVSGSIAIGGVSGAPARPLDVYGSAQFKDASGIGTTVWSEAVSGAGGIGTNTNHPFALIVNGSERGRISTSGSWIIGADPGGSELLRVGGAIHASSGGWAAFLDGITRIRDSSAVRYRADFQVNSFGLTVSPYDDVGVVQKPITLNASAVIVGTDPSGSELLRVGGAVKCSDVVCSAWSSLGNSLNTAANAAAATQLLGVSPSRRIKYVDQFHNVFTGSQLPWSAANNGGSNAAVAPGSGTAVGVVRHSSGATASANQRGGMTTTQASYLLGAIRIGFGIRQAPALALPDGTNQAVYRSGFYSAGGADDPAGGVYFRSTNGANWFAITRSGGVETATNTGVALAALGTFQDLFFDINSAGTQVRFYIGGSLVATHTTNIPSVALLLYSNVQRVAAVATAVAFDVDLTCLALEYSSDIIPGFYD